VSGIIIGCACCCGCCAISAPGTGLGSILLSLVGGLPGMVPGVVAATRGRDITASWVSWGWDKEVTMLGSMTGRLVPGSPGSLFCSPSLSLSLSCPQLPVSWETFSPSKGSPYCSVRNSGLPLYFSYSSWYLFSSSVALFQALVLLI